MTSGGLLWRYGRERGNMAADMLDAAPIHRYARLPNPSLDPLPTARSPLAPHMLLAKPSIKH